MRPFATLRLRRRRVLIAIFAVAALGLAGYLLQRQLAKYDVAEIHGSLAELGLQDLLVALLFVAGSYFCLTLSETLSVHYAGKRLPYRKIAFVSFIALSLGHNIGFAALSSGAIRYRFYSRWGLTLGDVGRIVALCGATVALGHATLAGLALLARSDLTQDMLGLSAGLSRAAGLGLLAAVGLYVAVAWRAGGAAVRVGRWRIAMPSLATAALQVAIGSANTACIAGVLFTALSAMAEANYLAVVAVYVVASAAAILSHVPGGLGVLEAVAMSFAPGVSTFGALVAFRALYFLAPLALGASLFAGFEASRRRVGRSGPAVGVPQPHGGER